MINHITCFESVNDLKALTGLSSEQLWQHRFNLDDVDGGFRSEVKLHREEFDDCGNHEVVPLDNAPTILHIILNSIENYCVGYSVAEYDGAYYYLIHHA